MLIVLVSCGGGLHVGMHMCRRDGSRWPECGMQGCSWHMLVGSATLDPRAMRSACPPSSPASAAHLQCVSSGLPACWSCQRAMHRGCTFLGHLHGLISTVSLELSSKQIQQTSSVSCLPAEGRGAGTLVELENRKQANKSSQTRLPHQNTSQMHRCTKRSRRGHGAS